MFEKQRPFAHTDLLALAAVLVLCAAARADGPLTDGVRISGVVRSQTSVANSVNVATGARSQATTAVGSIADGVRIDGRLNVTVQTGQIATFAAGAGQQATTSVGNVQEDVRGQTDVVISTGQIINASDPTTGRPGCVVIGTLGKVPGC